MDDRQPQPQAPPQQPPARGIVGVATVVVEPPAERPVNATADSNLTVSSWPAGQVAGAPASAMERATSNVSPQARQRNS
jgi:hypothetical protein